MSISPSKSETSSKALLCKTLNAASSTDHEVRQKAEKELEILETTKEFGIHLTEFLVDPEAESSIRQLTSELLKKYINNHWSSSYEKFQTPEIKLEVKQTIKKLLLLGMQDTVSEIRTAVVDTISAIAVWGCPGNWPELIDMLVSCLITNNNFAVQGAKQVLTTFTTGLSADQLQKVAPIILTRMLQLFQNQKDQYSIKTRSSAIEIVTTIGTVIATKDACEDNFTKQHLQPVILKFCEEFVGSLKIRSGSPTDTYNYKLVVVEAITMLITMLPINIGSYLEQILRQIWDTLIESAKVYHEIIVHEGKTADSNDSRTINDCENLIRAILQFMSIILTKQTVINKSSVVYQNILLDSLTQDKLLQLVLLMQVTCDQLAVWTNNPTKFLCDEEMELPFNNVRSEARNVLVGIFSSSKHRVASAMTVAILNEIQKMREWQSTSMSQASQESWKVLEVWLIAFCIAKSNIIDIDQRDDEGFHVNTFLEEFVLPTLNDSSTHPVLRSRCLSIGSLFAQRIPPRISSPFIKAIINWLQEELPVYTKLCAVKAVNCWVEAIELRTLYLRDRSEDVLKPHLQDLFTELFNFGSELQSVEHTAIVLESTYILARTYRYFFKDSTADQIWSLTSSAFLHFRSDSNVLCLCQKIFEIMVRWPQGIDQLSTHLLPILVQMMTVNPLNESKDGILALNILLNTLEGLDRSLNSSAIISGLPALCHCILNSHDDQTLTRGGEVLNKYLKVFGEPLIVYKDSEGKTGSQHISEAIVKLLQVQSSANSVRLTCIAAETFVLMVRGTTPIENIDPLIKAVHSKLLSPETQYVTRSLLVVYAQLIIADIDAVLNFLSSAPGLEESSALAFVMRDGFWTQSELFTDYDTITVRLAFCKILEYGVTHHDSELHKIIIQEKNQESQKAAPLLVKICQFFAESITSEMFAYAFQNSSSD